MKLEDRVKEAKKCIGRRMCISELSDDITQLLLKYAGGTGINQLTVEEFNWLEVLICDIIRNPQEVLNYEEE